MAAPPWPSFSWMQLFQPVSSFQGITQEHLDMLGPLICHTIRPLVFKAGLWSIEVEKSWTHLFDMVRKIVLSSELEMKGKAEQMYQLCQNQRTRWEHQRSWRMKFYPTYNSCLIQATSNRCWCIFGIADASMLKFVFISLGPGVNLKAGAGRSHLRLLSTQAELTRFLLSECADTFSQFFRATL